MAFFDARKRYELTNLKYKEKIKRLKHLIKGYVFENAALCDQVAQVQENTVIAREERKFLIKKIAQFEPYSDTEFHMQNKNNSTPNHGNHSETKRGKRKQVTDPLADCKPAKSRRSNPRSKKKTFQQIPVDSTGRPLFPIELGNLTVHSLGEIISDKPNFHDSEIIYPVGYVSTRLYCSMKNPVIKRVYTCKISENDGFPSFEIVADDGEMPISGASPDECHAVLLQQINKTFQEKVISTNPRGNDFFGLTHPTIQNLIQCSPGARKCSNYKWNKFEIGIAEFTAREQEPTLNFETLQRNITYSKYAMKVEVKEEPVDDAIADANGTLRGLLMS